MAAGDIGVNILKMAREGLRRDLTTALHLAATHKEPVCRPGLRVKTNGDFSLVNLTVHPVATNSMSGKGTSTLLSASNALQPAGEASTSAGRHAARDVRTGHERPPTDLFQYLVVLEEVSTAEASTPNKPRPQDSVESIEANDTDTQTLIAALRQELQAKEEYLQSTTEGLEASGEEMQSVNEELQSSNEELTTVNTELQNKVIELLRANNDMNNLLAGTGVGTVFVDQQMLVQRFTPAATQVINLIPTDVGRPLVHIVTNLVNYANLEEDVKSVLNSLTPLETENRPSQAPGS